MKIRYVVVRFHLSADPEHYIARVVPAGTINQEELVDLTVERNTTVGRADVVAVLEAYNQLIIDRVRDGYHVNTPLVNLSADIEGRFEGPGDQFDPRRHRVVVNCQPGQRMRRAMRHFRSVELVEKRHLGPLPADLVDVNSGTHNERLTPGGLAKLWGYRLKFDPADPAQGIFLIAEDRQETKVTVVGHNGPRRLFFSLPNLPPGRYRLEVRAVLRHGRALRCGELPELLTVE